MFDLTRFQRLTRRDLMSAGIEFYSHIANSGLVADSAPAINHIAVPRDKLLIVSSWVVITNPGATYNTNSVILIQRGLFDYYIEGMMPSYNQGTIESQLSIKRDHIILNGMMPRVQATFSGGVNNNQVRSHLRGFLIPKGQLPSVD